MTKKEYLLKLLTALDGKWSMARGLRLLVEQNVLDDQTLGWLQHIFAEALKQVNTQKSQESLLKGQAFLQKLQEKELADQTKDEELDQLLQTI